jgi:hypothetical protein
MHTATAEIDHQSMPLTLELLNILIDPNLLFLLFLAGIGGLAYEVFHPGVILPGTLGAVCLVLALFGFSVVPINWAGVVLIVLGVALLLAEAFVTSHGLIALSGVVALCAGGLLLFRTPGSDVSVSPFVVLTIAVLFGVAGDGGDQGGRGSAMPAAVIGLAGLAARRWCALPPAPTGEVYAEVRCGRLGAGRPGDTVIIRSAACCCTRAGACRCPFQPRERPSDRTDRVVVIIVPSRPSRPARCGCCASTSEAWFSGSGARWAIRKAGLFLLIPIVDRMVKSTQGGDPGDPPRR